MSSTRSFKRIDLSPPRKVAVVFDSDNPGNAGCTPIVEERDAPSARADHNGAALAGVSFLIHSSEAKLMESMKQEFAKMSRQSKQEAQRIHSQLEQQRQLMQQQLELVEKHNGTIQTLQREQGELLQAVEGLKQQLKEYQQSQSSQNRTLPLSGPAMLELPIQQSSQSPQSGAPTNRATRKIPVYSRYGAPDPLVLPKFANVISELKKRESKDGDVSRVKELRKRWE